MSATIPEREYELHDVGAEEDFVLDRFQIVEIKGRSIGVVHTVAGWFTIRNNCPHQGAPLCAGVVTGTMLPSGPDEMVWGLDGCVVRCPWHGWEFDLRTGRSLFEVSRDRTATYPVQVEHGRVAVMMPVRRPRP